MDMKREGEGGRGLPDRARPLVMRGHPEEQPVLSLSREGEACVSEEGQSFRGRKRGIRMKKYLNFREQKKMENVKLEGSSLRKGLSGTQRYAIVMSSYFLN